MNISIQDALPILRCPESNSTLYIQGDFLVNDVGARYPIREGIIDLVKEDRQDQNQIVEASYTKQPPAEAGGF